LILWDYHGEICDTTSIFMINQLNYKTILKFTLGVVLTAFISACNDYEIPDSPAYVTTLNKLAEKSPTGDIEGLKLPSGYNFSILPQDPRNPLNKEKVELGKLLFHETALATDAKNLISVNTYSCASCHHAGAGFQSGNRQGIGDGGEAFGAQGEGRRRNADCPEEMLDVQPLKSPSILNSAYQTNNLWNGQFGSGNVNVGTEGQWTAGTPLETNFLGYEGVEIQAIAGFSVHRLGVNTGLLFQEPYKTLFSKSFPGTDFQSLSEEKQKEYIGLAIAAYERTVVADMSPYQRYLAGDESSLSENEINGMELFFGKAECYTCHNGPALNSMTFHALGFPDLQGADIIGDYNEDAAKGRGGFTKVPSDNYKFKVPQLYNLEQAFQGL